MRRGCIAEHRIDGTHAAVHDRLVDHLHLEIRQREEEIDCSPDELRCVAQALARQSVAHRVARIDRMIARLRLDPFRMLSRPGAARHVTRRSFIVVDPHGACVGDRVYGTPESSQSVVASVAGELLLPCVPSREVDWWDVSVGTVMDGVEATSGVPRASLARVEPTGVNEATR